jgi:hypothetical protein
MSGFVLGPMGKFMDSSLFFPVPQPHYALMFGEYRNCQHLHIFCM